MNQPLSNRSYSILITLYDPSLLSSPPPAQSEVSLHLNPLIPTTSTHLPTRLDREFSRELDKGDLVLPPSSKSFWELNLQYKSTKELRISTPPQSPPLRPSLNQSHSHSHSQTVGLEGGGEGGTKIWSQNFGEISSSFSNLKLWTPSQLLPTSTPTTSSASKRKEAILDFRFGPLSIDWIKMNNNNNNSSEGGGGGGGGGEVQGSGTTSLYWGTIHLYREAGITQEDEGREPTTRDTGDDVDGKTLGMVSVPGNLNASSILKFLNNNNNNNNNNDHETGGGRGVGLESIEEIRMLRDSTPSRSIVVLKFNSREKALEFRKEFNGKKYWRGSKDSEICQIVPISQILIKPTSLPPFTFPLNPGDPSLKPPSSKSKPKKKKKLPSKQEEQEQDREEEEGHKVKPPLVVEEREIPLCPICLEKLDSKITGLVQILCKHSYHCNCLLRWGDSRCPVCRATNFKPSTTSPIEGEQEELLPPPRNCTICTSPSNLWICLICANVGCGRYQGGHAFTHFLESGHSYSLELQTGRIWSYTDDEYVHRLLRVPSSTTLNNNNNNNHNSTSNARLIELPSIPSSSSLHHHHNPAEDISQKIANSYNDQVTGSGGTGTGGGPNRSTEEEQSKLELIALEYSSLLSQNLTEQREYFQEELSRSKTSCLGWEKRVEELERFLEKEKHRFEMEKKGFLEIEKEKNVELKTLRDRLESLEKELKRHEDDRKRERNEATKLKKSLEKELEMEKSVTSNLTDNLGNMKREIEVRRKETEEVRGEVEELKDQLNDLMAALTMRDKIEQEPEGSELRGASIGVVQGGNEGTGDGKSPSQILKDKRKKKPKKK
ncbi:hypothetical protein JCM5350_005523 [Sporobolomyces pararoseus]